MTADVGARLAAEGLTASTWSNGPGDRYPAHRHGYDKVIVATEGSIVFGLPERGGAMELRAGDRLELPAGTLHDATVGSVGVACLEAHLASGTLGPDPRHVPAWAALDVAAETAATSGA